jgi:hypothetical protein
MAGGCGGGWKTDREKGCSGWKKADERMPPMPCASRKGAEGRLAEDLREETVKWQRKAEDLYQKVSGEDEFLENVSAYIRDCQYFLEKNDLIRAFEAIIWAWAWMEIGLQKGFLQQND